MRADGWGYGDDGGRNDGSSDDDDGYGEAAYDEPDDRGAFTYS